MYEIEHKYLVKDSSFKAMATSSRHIRQGYLCREPERVVRVRIADDTAFLTVKGRTVGDTRIELEYPVPVSDAEVMLTLCTGDILEKTRYFVPYEGHTWEVDVFGARHEGLVTAEIELTSSNEKYEIPGFVGENVTGDPRYYNSNISKF